LPWHYHNNVHDTFYVLAGSIQDPKEKIELTPGQCFAVPPKRPHLVTNAGGASAVFLVLQGVGEYDFVPLITSGNDCRRVCSRWQGRSDCGSFGPSLTGLFVALHWNSAQAAGLPVTTFVPEPGRDLARGGATG
jgi:hypothetical protein